MNEKWSEATVQGYLNDTDDFRKLIKNYTDSVALREEQVQKHCPHPEARVLEYASNGSWSICGLCGAAGPLVIQQEENNNE